MITGYGEQVKPYLIATLESVGAVVSEAKATKTAESKWETPNIFVEMLPDTYDDQNWTTCHARLKAIIECAEAEKALERANNVLSLIAQRIIFYTEFGLPVLSGVKPVWLPGATVKGSRPTKGEINPHNIPLVWECDFPTACGGR